MIEIGFHDYNLSDSRKILGDLENGPIVNSIILLTKKVIYDSFKKEKKPAFIHIKNEVKNHYYLEKYMQYTNRKKYQFDKKWHLLNIYYEND